MVKISAHCQKQPCQKQPDIAVSITYHIEIPESIASSLKLLVPEVEFRLRSDASTRNAMLAAHLGEELVAGQGDDRILTGTQRRYRSSGLSPYTW